ncbi:sensor histidine kinase [Streptomyces sp. NPDC001978]|uniref:sensor histidine kinase n=1 Tax=Streptomyces sp. NPDC001978 TaxID=3364627 RepID=UPI0036777A74
MAADSMGRRRRSLRELAGTVRVRSTIAAVLVVGAALVVGAMMLLGVLRNTLTHEVRSAARLQAEEVAVLLASGQDLPALPAAEDEQFVQVLDGGGHVVASSPNVEGKPAIVQLRPGQSAQIATPVDDDEFVAVATAADTPNGRVTVIVGRALVDVFESIRVVSRLLVIGLPALLVLVAFTTWKLVGRVLAPVEAIRGEVDEISAAELHRRVPEPPGTDEIARLAATMNRMLGRLERAQASQRRFISDVSHELRSPVASIRQHAEVALAHPERTPVGGLAETVLAEDLRVQYLIDDLLLLARADEHTLELPRRALDLDDLVFDEANRLRATTGLRIDTTAVSAGRVGGDERGLRRVLRNLADNAAHHARSHVAFALVERDGTVTLTVDDDGPGIPETERERVFERFVRLDDARARDDGGTGLGLAIVAEIVRAHDGSVTIAGSSLGGARFEVNLPGGDGGRIR